MASQERITVHNLAGNPSPPSKTKQTRLTPNPTDLKNTSDDAIPNYLNSLKFRQDHRLTDTRLALGYGAFALAAACFLWDRQLGFEGTKYWTAAAVAVYALLNGVLTYWVTYVERGVVYQGTAPDGSKVSIATSTQKNVPVYNVKITVTPAGSGSGSSSKQAPSQTIELDRSFTGWFDVQGHFVALPFQTMLATAVPAIGKADPKRVAAAATAAPPSGAAGSYSSELLEADAATLDALLASSSSEATGADATAAAAAGKKTKRRKA
ncbi:hypothetical protein SLS62_000134 [Diatrype stigma]|uniref:Signal peptidase complex subunit 2 n=1 Tax=Diatrype stigma TaxID=117547 RepID=A0AAN9V1Y8_9PEZI